MFGVQNTSITSLNKALRKEKQSALGRPIYCPIDQTSHERRRRRKTGEHGMRRDVPHHSPPPARSRFRPREEARKGWAGLGWAAAGLLLG